MVNENHHLAGHTAVPNSGERATLEAEVRRLIAQACEIRSRINATTPTGRLPDNVLSEIFAAYAGYYYPLLRWVVITRVCRRWRSIALSRPLLWRSITPATRPMLSLFLRRAANSPLSLEWHATSTNLMPPYSTFQSTRGPRRFVSVELDISHEQMGEILDLLDGCWVGLKELTLFVPGKRHNPAPIVLLPPSFEGNPPKDLRQLRLEGVVPPSWLSRHPNFSIYASLRTLFLGCNAPETFEIPLDRFLLLLGHCSALKELEFPLMILTEEEERPKPPKRVELNQLRQLTLSIADSKIPLGRLFDRLVFPDTTHIVVNGDCGGLGTTTLFPKDPLNFRLLFAVDSVSLTYTDVARLTASRSNRVGCLCRNEQDSCFSMEILPEMGKEVGTVIPVLEPQMSEAFSNSPITNLTLSFSEITFPECNIQGMFLAFPQLTSLTIGNGAAMPSSVYLNPPTIPLASVLRVLTANPLSSDPVLVPLLRSVTFLGFHSTFGSYRLLKEFVRFRSAFLKESQAEQLEVWIGGARYQ